MKKVISGIVLVVLILSLTSCTGLNSDPIDLGRKLGDIYGDDAGIYIIMSPDDIKEYMEDFESTSNGVYAIMEIDGLNENSDEEGYLFYCENSTQAEKIENDFYNSVREWDLAKDGIVVERKNSVVFLGAEEVLKNIHSITYTF